MAAAGVIDESIVIRLREVRQIRVRYGRARLTVQRLGGLSGNDLGRTIAAYEDGRVDAEQVCWAFVRERVVDQTPSFDWGRVELPLLLDRVIAVSTRPEFSSSSVDDVAAALVLAAREEAEAAKKAREGGRQLVEQVVDHFALGAKTARLLEGFTLTGKLAGLADQYSKGNTARHAASIGGIDVALGGQMHASLAETIGVARQAAAASSALQPMPGLQQHLDAAKIAASAAVGRSAFDIKKVGIGFSGPMKFAARDYKHVLESQVGISGVLANYWAPRGPELFEEIAGRGHLAAFGDFKAPAGFTAQFDHGRLGGLASVRGAFPANVTGTAWGAGLYENRAMGFPNFSYSLPDLPAFGKLFDAFADPLKAWRERFQKALPENWQDLDRDELDAAVEMTVNAGPSLAWAPRVEIVRKLIATKNYSERRVVLEDNATEIVEDVEAALEEVARDDLKEAVEGVRKAIAAARDGHVEAAQALAGVVVGHLVHDFLEADGFRDVRELFGDVDPWKDAKATSFSLFAVGRGWVRVLDRIPKAGDDFNRAVTLHFLSPAHNRANLLGALLLLAGLIPELQRMQDRYEARQLQAAWPPSARSAVQAAEISRT